MAGTDCSRFINSALDGPPALLAGRGMPEAVAPNDSEAYEVLMQMAGRRTLPVPGDLIVRHVLALQGNWDWPVRRAAMEALLRRFGSVWAQEIAVLEAPGKGPWG